MTAPKVSIIVPVYNTELYLKECVDSLTNQTLKEVEILLVDDGSREECARLCDELAEKDDRVRVLHKENSGQGLARNYGLEFARGEYVAFLDSDDYVDTKMYEVHYEAAVKYDADLVMSGVAFVGGNTFVEDGGYEEKQCFAEETIFENEGMKELLLGFVGALPKEADDSRYGVSVCKNLYRRSVFTEKNVRFLSERKVMSEDAIFMVDFSKACRRAVGLPGVYYCYRRNETSFSKAYRSDRFEKILIFLSIMEEHLRETLKKEEYQLYLDRLIQGYGRVLCSQEIMHAKEQGIPYSALRPRLKAICTSEKIASALKTYPWYQLPKKQAAFAFAMKYRLYFLQKLMVLLRAR